MMEKLVELYITFIVRLHGVLIYIISNQRSLFTSHLKSFLHGLGTRLDIITIFHH